VDISIAGQEQPARIEVEFRHMGREALNAWMAGLDPGSTYVEAVTPMVVNWRGVDTPFSAQALAALLEGYPLAARGLLDAFVRECTEAKAKN
jgi:hypothetical protein